VEIRLGYAENLNVMLTGNFTTMEPNFPSSGGPTLTVRGLNVLHQLRRQQHTRTWRDRTDSQIVQSLERDFPLPIETDPNAQHDEPPLEFLAQRSQYDIDFIFSRARERGYVVFIQEADRQVRGSRKRLYFGPSHSRTPPGLRDVTFHLEWGKSLVDFRPTLTTANQVRSVTVRGWSRSQRQTISATVNLDDRRLSRNRDLYELLESCDPREEIVVDQPVFTVRQAERMALDILMDRQKEMVQASGTTVGLPDLRAGKQVLITNVGARFSGTYFVTETTHSLSAGGYVTRFKARREDQGGGRIS
jgi:phage protein D